MLTIIITGAAGFIGSRTVEQLLEEGHRVVGVDNFRTGNRENLAAALANPAFAFCEADVSAADVLSDLTSQFRPDALIHLAGLVGVEESMSERALNFRLNFEATRNVVAAGRRHRLPRIVFASSAAVYGDSTDLPLRESASALRPINPYGEAKLDSENLLLEHAAQENAVTLCLRYFNVFGPGQHPASPHSGVVPNFARSLRAGRSATIFGDGLQTRDFVSVRDVARANALAATGAGRSSAVVNICTGRSTSVRQLAEIFATHRPGMPAPHFAPARPGGVQHSVGSPDRARTELGFVAQHTLEDGLAELVREEMTA